MGALESFFIKLGGLGGLGVSVEPATVIMRMKRIKLEGTLKKVMLDKIIFNNNIFGLFMKLDKRKGFFIVNVILLFYRKKKRYTHNEPLGHKMNFIFLSSVIGISFDLEDMRNQIHESVDSQELNQTTSHNVIMLLSNLF